MQNAQLRLFDAPFHGPAGFRYQAGLVPAADQHALAERIAALPLKAFEFHGHLGKRRVVSFGWHYDFNAGELRRAESVPAFLLPLRERAAAFAGVAADDLQHVLVIEYAPGAGIGWHRDRPIFEDVVGVSLVSPCLFRLRRRTGAAWQRASLTVEPGSAYLLRGPSRTDWEHSIPPVDTLRYSVTFRTFRPGRRPA
jgi:alkylated DNA repair dioxygenase AlkB